MKLLLTSGGITNQLIADALSQLVGKRLQDTKLVFIPTASNVELGDKDWFIDDLINLKKQNFKSITITDISTVEEKVWRPQLEEADVLFFEGGNEYYLMDWINKSGLINLLPELLKTKVYVGLSAGSMVTGPDLNIQLANVIYGETIAKNTVPGLKMVNFYFIPHLNSPYFPVLRKDELNEVMNKVMTKTYALDDQMAIKIDRKDLSIVGDGEYLEYN